MQEVRAVILAKVTTMTTTRPFLRNQQPRGWMVDVRIVQADGTVYRERKVFRTQGRSAAQRWGESRERFLLQHGVPEPEKEVPTLDAFAPRFLDGHARANRQKPSSLAAKETVLRVHLLPRLGTTRLDAISSEAVQRLKFALHDRSAKTTNNILTTLGVLLKQAVEWGVLTKLPCTIRLLKVQKTTMAFHDFPDYERLVDVAAGIDPTTHVIVLLGGDAGLRLGEMLALQWANVDLHKRQLTIQHSEWKGHLTTTKGGRIRYVPMTARLAAALAAYRHLRSTRVLVQGRRSNRPNSDDYQPLTMRLLQGIVNRAARRAHVKAGVHILRHTFCSHLAMRGAPARAIQELAGHQDLTTTQRYMHLSPAALDHAIRLLETGTRGN